MAPDEFVLLMTAGALWGAADDEVRWWAVLVFLDWV